MNPWMFLCTAALIALLGTAPRPAPAQNSPLVCSEAAPHR